MDRDEEFELITIIKNTPDSAQAADARARLHEEHRGRIRSLAKRRDGRRHSRPPRVDKKLRVETTVDDYTQAGHEGLAKALQEFDPEKGVRLWSYAEPYVKGRIGDEAVRLGQSGFAIPENLRALLKKKRRALERLGDDARRDEVAAELGVDAEELDVVDGISSHTASLSAPIAPDVLKSVDDEEGPGTLGEMVATEQRPDGWSVPFDSFETYVEINEARRQVARLLDVLTKREHRLVVDRYYGGLSGSAIARELHVSKQAIDKAIRVAIIKMRVEAEVRGWIPEERKQYFTPPNAALRAFTCRRAATVSRWPKPIDWYEAENINHMKGGWSACRR